MAVSRKNIKADVNYNPLGLGSMPDFSRAGLMYTLNQDTNAGLPIWKINVPGYLHLYAPGNDCNQDGIIVASYSVDRLQDWTAYTNDKYYVLTGTYGDNNAGGSPGIVPIYPGSTTYVTLCGGYISYHFIFIPCMYIPTIISTDKFFTVAGKVISDWSNDNVNGYDYNSLMFPGNISTCPGWYKMFNNNWKANFPSIDLSKYLVLRQSHTSDYEVAA